MSQTSFRALARGDAALAPRLLMALLRQGETRRPGRQRTAPTPMAGLRPHRADSPAARLLSGGTDYRVPLTAEQADSYRQIYAQIKVRPFEAAFREAHQRVMTSSEMSAKRSNGRLSL